MGEIEQSGGNATKGRGKGEERKGEDVGGELAGYGPELHACGVRSGTALRRRSAPRCGEVEGGRGLTWVKLCALMDGSGVDA